MPGTGLNTLSVLFDLIFPKSYEVGKHLPYRSGNWGTERCGTERCSTELRAQSSKGHEARDSNADRQPPGPALLRAVLSPNQSRRLTDGSRERKLMVKLKKKNNPDSRSQSFFKTKQNQQRKIHQLSYKQKGKVSIILSKPHTEWKGVMLPFAVASAQT